MVVVVVVTIVAVVAVVVVWRITSSADTNNRLNRYCRYQHHQSTHNHRFISIMNNKSTFTLPPSLVLVSSCSLLHILPSICRHLLLTAERMKTITNIISITFQTSQPSQKVFFSPVASEIKTKTENR